MSNDLKVHFLKALKADPDFSEAHFQLAILFYEENDNKNAEKHFKSAIASDISQASKFTNRGENLLTKNQFHNAKDQFVKAQEKKNHCSVINYHLSTLYIKENKLNKAQICLQESIELNPGYALSHRNLGILLSQQKNYDDARLHIEKSIDLDYSDSLSHLHLGIIMKKTKDYSDAEQHFLSALDINPQYTECMMEMADLQVTLKNITEAKKYYQLAKKISPDIQHSLLDTNLEK